MNTLLNLLDFIVLVLIVIHLLRRVSAGLANAPGAPILIICVALVAAFFATVSLTVYMGLVDAADSLMRVVLLAFVVGMAVLVGVSWTSKPVA
jgi:hypothetical protein